MAVLLAVNEGILSSKIPSEDEAKNIVKRVQKVIEKFDKPDLDVNPEL